MPVFKFEIKREVTVWDTVTRYIEAPNAETAHLAAGRLAASFNMDCPDDTESEGAECGSWFTCPPIPGYEHEELNALKAEEV